MQQPTLFHKFTSALSWNAFLYFAHRSMSAATTFVLYRFLSTSLFSAWTTTLSITYLALLWLDFGFRKSIARYAPVFTAAHQFPTFIRAVLTFQLCVLFISAPIFGMFLPRFLHTMSGIPVALGYSAGGLFITEGLVELLRLIYHARFLNRPFNLLVTAARIIEAGLIIMMAAAFASSLSLVTILVTKITASLFIITIALLMLPRLYKTERAPYDHPQPPPQAALWRKPDVAKIHSNASLTLAETWKKFAFHSLMMWLTNMIKSLSERNFILPFLTYILGPSTANTFKLAQDSALLFERLVIKTIGTADTALLSHVEIQKGNTLFDSAFQKLTRQIAGLCIPLFGIFLFFFLAGKSFFKDQIVFQIFLLLTITYLIEVLLSPYERVLEVARRYLLLWLSYVPYMVSLIFLFYSASSIGLLSFVLVVQCVRLVSSICMVVFTYWQYHVRFPVVFALGWMTVAVGAAALAAALFSAIVRLLWS